MKSSTFSLLLTIVLALAVALSDYFLKKASSEHSPFLNRHFLVGLVITIAVTFGWVWVMPHLKLAYIGVVYSITIVLALSLVGAAFFGESLSGPEWLGVALAIASMVLLYQRLA